MSFFSQSSDFPPRNTRGLINARMAGQWQATPDAYSTTHSWPLHNYGTYTPYGLVPHNNVRAFSGAQQANMYAQAQRGGNLMSFGGMAQGRGMHPWGDLGSRYPVRYWW